MQKHTRNFIWGAIAALILSAIVLPKFFGTSATGNPASSAPPALQVEALLTRTSSVNQVVRSTGTLLANEQVTLYSETTGKITQLLFREGRRVQKGALLVKINDTELQARLRKAQNDRKLAADREYRMKQQFENNLISQEAYDISLNELKAIDADIDLIEAQIAKTEIRAPFSGRIGLKSVSEGSFITTATRIAELVSINPMKIEFSVSEKYAGKVAVGDQVRFNVQGSSETHNAKVYAIEPRLDPSTRTLNIRAITPNDSGRFFAGSFAQIEWIADTRKDAIMIPTEALIPELGGQKVYRLRQRRAESVAVETGLRTETAIQISAGLQPGDTVITTGILQLRPGLAIEVSQLHRELP